jgi:hypothetical protein
MTKAKREALKGERARANQIRFADPEAQQEPKASTNQVKLAFPGVKQESIQAAQRASLDVVNLTLQLYAQCRQRRCWAEFHIICALHQSNYWTGFLTVGHHGLFWYIPKKLFQSLIC